MCDDDSFDDIVSHPPRRELMARRAFGSLTLGAGLASLLPLGCAPPEPATSPAPAGSGSAAAPAGAPADAGARTTEAEVAIATPDGTCDAYFVHPAAGASAAVLVWPDILGLRPAFRQMGKRLAQEGYAVLVVNPFYRKQKAPTAPPHVDFEDKATREGLMALMQTLTADTAATDAKAFTAWLDQQPSVDKARKIGTMGYCMGGPLVMRTAAGARGRGRELPRRGARDGQAGQPSPPDPEDEGALLDRDRGERRREAAGGEGQAERGVRAGVADRERGGVRGDEARLVPPGLARVRRGGGGEGVE
jgi:hypothetical protein